MNGKVRCILVCKNRDDKNKFDTFMVDERFKLLNIRKNEFAIFACFNHYIFRIYYIYYRFIIAFNDAALVCEAKGTVYDFAFSWCNS